MDMKTQQIITKKNSARLFLDKIKIPTYLIAAFDDPFLDKSMLYIPKNKCITCFYTLYGGHVGFWYFDNGLKYWIDEKIMTLLKS